MLLGIYVAASTGITVVLPWLDDLLHPKTESDRIAVLGVTVGILTIALISIQIWIAFRQADLQKTELAIIERQDDILNRVEDLTLHNLVFLYPRNPWEDEKFAISLDVTNSGKGVRGVYVDVYLESIEGQPSLSLVPNEDWIQGKSEYFPTPTVTLTQFSKWFDVLLPGEGQTTPLDPLLVMVLANGEYAIRWRLRSLNGTFPMSPQRFGGPIGLQVFDKPDDMRGQD